MPPSPTIVDLFIERIRNTPDKLALLLPKGDTIRELTWREIGLDVARAVEAFQSQEIKPSDRVAIISENRYEWLITDLALQVLGAAVVPLSPNASRTQLEFLVTGNVKRTFIGDVSIATKINKLLSLNQLSYISFEPAENLKGQFNITDWAIIHNEADFAFQNRGGGQQDTNGHLETLFTVARQNRTPNQPATLVFTSGTSENTRGVTLTGEQLAANALATMRAFEDEAPGRRLCWLPMYHLYCRVADIYVWIGRGTELVLAEDRESVITNARATQPDFINGVPLFYERIYRHAISQKWPSDEMKSRLHEMLGGKIRLLVAGGAALPVHVEKFFNDCELPLVQGYGLTEAGPVVTTCTLKDRRAGSVGRALSSIEIKIDVPPTAVNSQTDLQATNDNPIGEILVRSPSIMTGYWDAPSATAKRIRDGWLHTGDLGNIDADGFLWITGRADDTINLLGGTKVQPSEIETHIAACPLVAQVMIIGHQQKCLAALIVPEPLELRTLIKSEKLWVWSKKRAVTHPKIKEILKQKIDELLKDRPPHEQVHHVAMLGKPWTAENGELTESLKLRRGMIRKNNERLIKKLYAK